MFDFTGKTALVVGGAGYLCSPVCKALAERGASLAITDLNTEKASAFAEEIAREYKVPAIGLAMDLGDETSIENVVRQTVEKLGRLDVLVNAAFFSTGKLLEELGAEDFDRTCHVQLTGSFVLSRVAAKAMIETAGGGAMVHFSSMYGSISPEPHLYFPPEIKPNPIEYGVTKAGLEQMVRYLAVHYAPQNIRVNGVAPGSFPHGASPSAVTDHFAAFQANLAAKTPMGRIGRQDELAGPVVFLASNAASYVTGQILAVDGGVKIW